MYLIIEKSHIYMCMMYNMCMPCGGQFDSKAIGKKTNIHTHTKPKQLEIRMCKAFAVQPCTSFVEHSASHLFNTSLPTLDNLHPTPSGRYVLPLFIPVSKWLGTPISKTVRPFGRGLTTLILRGTYILTMVPHTSNGRQISHLFRRIFVPDFRQSQGSKGHQRTSEGDTCAMLGNLVGGWTTH